MISSGAFTPAGESILIDSGNPGTRDAGRIVAAAKEAGVTEITHYITTHWHSDHVGGIAEVAKAVPVRAVYGHTIPDPLPKDINPDLVAAWKALSSTPLFLEAGDEIELKGRRPAWVLRRGKGRLRGNLVAARPTFYRRRRARIESYEHLPIEQAFGLGGAAAAAPRPAKQAATAPATRRPTGA